MYLGSSSYQLLGDDGAVQLHTGLNDDFSNSWNVIAAKNNSSSFQVLFEGEGSLEGKNMVWTTNANGGYVSETNWLTGAQATSAGYESVFNMDLNNNGIID